jgi:hypothetical protein
MTLNEPHPEGTAAFILFFFFFFFEHRFPGTHFYIYIKIPIATPPPSPPVMKWVAPTDSRMRPDQRLLEDGESRAATEEKKRLEEWQRAARKRRENGDDSWVPRWFEKRFDPESGTEGWRYKGEYYEARTKHDWSRCPNIFTFTAGEAGGSEGH